MAVYLVDYENVNGTLLANECILQEGDRVVIFYSEQASSISIDTLGKLQSRGIEISFIKTIVGTNNALDFQLVSYLGYLIHEDKNRLFHIVSRDNGFLCVCKFWKDQNVEVNLIQQIGSGQVVKKQAEKPKKKKLKQVVPSVIPEGVEGYTMVLEPIITDASQLIDTVEAIKNAVTRTEINIWLTKHYNGKMINKINKAIKPLIKKLPGE